MGAKHAARSYRALSYRPAVPEHAVTSMHTTTIVGRRAGRIPTSVNGGRNPRNAAAAEDRLTRIALRLVVASFAAVWLLCPSPARAAGRWLPATTLSRTTDVSQYPQVASDARGGALVVWSEILGEVDYVVRSARQSRPGGRWSRAANLSPLKQASLADQLAENLRGAAIVVWDQGFESTPPQTHPPQEFIGSSFLRTSGSAWSSPRRVSPFSAVTPADRAGVGVDARGDAIAVWIDDVPTGFTVEAASARVGSERFSAPTTLAGPATLESLAIAVSPGGAAVAVWLQGVGGGPFTGARDEVIAAVRSARGVWGPAVPLGSEYELPGEADPTTNPPGPKVAIDHAGAAIVVWQHQAGDKVLPEADVLDARTMRWGPSTAIARSDAIDPVVSLDAAGDATVAWTTAGNGVATSSRQLTGGCSWTRPQTLLKAQRNIPFPQVAASADGATMIAWEGPVAAAVRSSPGSSWERPATLSTSSGGETQVALDPKGDAVVAWEQPGRPYKYEVVRAARYVVDGPAVVPKPLRCR
jgi:hypothetical protein